MISPCLLGWIIAAAFFGLWANAMYHWRQTIAKLRETADWIEERERRSWS